MRFAPENHRKSIYINNLGRAGRGGDDVSPLVVRGYVDIIVGDDGLEPPTSTV